MATRLIKDSPRAAGESVHSGLPRLALSRERAKAVARHFRRTALRISVLLVADLATLVFISWANELLPFGHAAPLVDPAFAVLLGLMLVRSYGRAEFWRKPARVFAGVGLGVLAAGWGSLNVSPAHTAPFLLFVWLATATVVSLERWTVAVAVAFAKRAFLSPQRVLIVGADGEELDSIQSQVRGREGMEVIGRITVPLTNTDVWHVLEIAKPDTVIIAGELPTTLFADLIRAAKMSGCYVLSLSRYEGAGALRPNIVWWGSTRFVELSLPELTASELAAKRTVDVVGSLLGLIVLSPFFGVIAALVKATSTGPVFFTQTRVGRGGETFKMWKFRTMRADASDAPHREYVLGLMRRSESAEGQGDAGHVYKLRDDSRITPIGSLLRKTSLDELPQLINVLRGEMSLVGPRPPLPYEVSEYDEWQFDRLGVRPGITGLWQVSGRNRLTYREMCELDAKYVGEWSLWLDLRILLNTFPVVLTNSGRAS